MNMPIRRLRKFLDNNHVEYRVIEHPIGYTSQQIVEAAHESGKEFAKTVMLKVDGHMVMAVLPANHKINFDHFKQAMNAKSVRLATEAEFKNFFPDCEIGAMPPFGELYDVDVVIADSLAENDMISFNAGTHREMIKMSYKDFDRLVNPSIVNIVVVTVIN
jgi:Ala-tRNA(Pro) deacylase